MQTHHIATNVTKNQIVSLITTLAEVPDPRMTSPVDHDLTDILMIALCAILSGGASFYDLEDFGEVRLPWLKTFLRLRHGAPKHDTYNRVFQALNPRAFGDCLASWTPRCLVCLLTPCASASVRLRQCVGHRRLSFAGGGDHAGHGLHAILSLAAAAGRNRPQTQPMPCSRTRAPPQRHWAALHLQCAGDLPGSLTSDSGQNNPRAQHHRLRG